MLWKAVLALLFLANSFSNILTRNTDSTEHAVKKGRMSTNCECGRANRNPARIIGGKLTGENEYPLMVGIVKKNIYNKNNKVVMKNFMQCGASLITHRHVLSAAHCFYDDYNYLIKPEELAIILGAHNLIKFNYKDPRFYKTPEKIIIHPEYYQEAPDAAPAFDIAIIIIPYTKFTKLIEPVCVPVKRFIPHDQRLKSLGWGKVSAGINGRLSPILKETTMIGLNNNDCIRAHADVKLSSSNIRVSHQICMKMNGTSSCQGDSGGPVIWADPDTNRYTLVGITSYSLDNCVREAVAVDVSYCMSWIQKVIKETYPEERICGKLHL